MSVSINTATRLLFAVFALSATVLYAQLLCVNASTRFDMDGQMSSAAQPLTAEDINLLADYMSALR